MSIFMIKIIAYVTMFLDHIKYAVPQTEGIITTYFGRLSYPLFAFLISEGYIHTKNLEKYYERLFIFAIISQVPFMLFRTLVGDFLLLNILFTLLLGLLCIDVYNKINNKFLGLLYVFAICILGQITKVDYRWYGVLLIFLFYITRNNKFLLSISFITLNFIYIFLLIDFNINLLTMRLLIYFLSISASLIVILSYNGKLGRKVNSKIYYFIYPVHLIILYLYTLFF